MTTALRATGAAVILLAGATAARAAPPSPWDGTWRTDMSSINFSKKPEVVVIKDGTETNSTSVPPYSIKADGAFHPVAAHDSFDAKMVKVVDDRTVEETYRKNGRDTSFNRAVLSPDGKTMTIDWKDMTNPGAPVATGQVMLTRVSPAPAGAHATSGGFIASKADASADAVTWTLKMENGALSYSTPTGQSYTAKVGGPAAPYKGDPGTTTVKVARAGPHELVETDYYNGKAVSVLHMTVSPDGKTMTMSSENLKNGRKSSAKAIKS